MFNLNSEKMLMGGGANFEETPVRFDYTGAVQTYVVPKGCRKLKVDCVGASGGGNAQGGRSYAPGGRVQCVLKVSSNQELYIYVGQRGKDGNVTSGGSPLNYMFNGGGYIGIPSSGYDKGCGGGASDIRTVRATNGWYNSNHSSWSADDSLLSRLVVAGGGGGFSNFGIGGSGGGLTGGTGTAGNGSKPGTGGTQTAAGTGGYTGDFGVGAFTGYRLAGGGGGGWYGGGGGYITDAGGGGSSYTHPTLCSDVIHTQGYSTAPNNGYVIITPLKK